MTAGIAQGAVLVDVGGHRIRSYQDLQTALRGSGTTGKVKVTVVDANGKRMTRDVSLKDSKLGISVQEMPVSVPIDVNVNNNNSSSNNSNNSSGTIPQPLPNNNGVITPQHIPSQATPVPTVPNSTIPKPVPSTPRPQD